MTNKFLILLFLVFPFSLMAQTSIKLNLQQGETYDQNTSNSVSIEQTVNGQPMSINMDNESQNTFFLKEVEGNNYIFEIKFTSLEVGLEMGPQLQTFTSEGGEDPFSKILKALTHQSFIMTISNRGEVIGIDNMDDFWEGVTKETQDIPEMQRNQVISQLKQSYGKEQLKSNYEKIFSIYPSKPVKRNEKWEINSKLVGAMSADISRSFVLEKLSKESVIIKGTSKISTNPENKEFTVVNGMPSRFEGGGTMTSTFNLDKKIGWITSATINQEMKGVTILQAQGQEMTIPMVINSLSVVKEGHACYSLD
ncbi:hypothetical protein EI427_21245 [Flammeovirga pectinis]|uniref:DUF4412 domain-containing protein n=1 Tax=Flammeovirga pectinis TaxID=2494373 RepID=A0A3Q9FPU6_9BACT|nr:DUF6263 family protein [Flammeovirga pectinis]AZQ64753.1 hypothetical protein EI427_21245 [Flammeovirga pectinis]